MTPEDIKDLKVIFATFKFDLEQSFEDKIRKILKESNKRKPYVEPGYRE